MVLDYFSKRKLLHFQLDPRKEENLIDYCEYEIFEFKGDRFLHIVYSQIGHVLLVVQVV
jgi:hypothetical protein